MRIGSLFSGYGGADLAVASVFPDAHPAWFVEFDRHPSEEMEPTPAPVSVSHLVPDPEPVADTVTGEILEAEVLDPGEEQ